jgi:GGDEF domain-containing protein
MTDYTGVPFTVILDHLRDWRDETSGCIEALRRLQAEAERHSPRVNQPNSIVTYIKYFVDLLERYLGDFGRLLVELPTGVTTAHVEIVEQIYKSASFEEDKCVRFSRDHIDREMKDEELRWLIDEIYQQSRSMLTDYHDLSNLIPRLRTFVGAAPKLERELEQKFGILFSAAQEQRDFEVWASDAAGVSGYAIGVIFLDIDDFKRLNSAFTESVVDHAILPHFQQLLRKLTLHRGAAYRHGGEEIVVMLPNCGIDGAPPLPKSCVCVLRQNTSR